MTQYLPLLPRTVTVTQVEGWPAKVADDDDTLMPSNLETRPCLASPRAPNATAGLKMFSRPSNGLAPLTEMHCSELLDVVVVDEVPEFPEFEVEPVLPEFPLDPALDEQ